MPGDGSEPPALHSASVQRLVHKEPVHNSVLLQFAPNHFGLSMSSASWAALHCLVLFLRTATSWASEVLFGWRLDYCPH
jgi:hypothetical protein